MSTYTLSGSGTQTLSANVTALHVAVTTPPVNAGNGRANPTALYDVGLLRLGDATGFFPPIPVVGGPQWESVPQGTTRLGYAIFGAGVVTITEVIGGIIPFSGPAGADGATGPAGSAGSTTIQTLTSDGTFTAFDFTAIPSTPYAHLELWLLARLDTATSDDFVNVQFNGDTGANYTWAYDISGSGGESGSGAAAGTTARVADIPAATAPVNSASRFVMHIPFYLETTFHKCLTSRGTLRYGTSGTNTQVQGYSAFWLSTDAIDEVKLLAASGHFVSGSKAALIGVV